MKNIVITISRQYGSGGKNIAALLGKKRGVQSYNRVILRHAPGGSGINEPPFWISA